MALESSLVNRATLREQVRDRLRDAIIEGEFPPGTRLAETDLAERYGVSRGTVREALRYLQQSGLVAGADRTSLSVRTLDVREIVELFQVRAALEGLAAELVLTSPQAAAIIDRLEERLPYAPSGTPYAAKIAADMGFHEQLCVEAGNTALLQSWRLLKDMMLVVFAGAEGNSANSALMARDYHQPVIDGLRSGDPVVAREMIREHMRGAAERWVPRDQRGLLLG